MYGFNYCFALITFVKQKAIKKQSQGSIFSILKLSKGLVKKFLLESITVREKLVLILCYICISKE